MQKFYTAILDFVIQIHVSCRPIKSFTEILVNLTLGQPVFVNIWFWQLSSDKVQEGFIEPDILFVTVTNWLMDKCNPLMQVYST